MELSTYTRSKEQQTCPVLLREYSTASEAARSKSASANTIIGSLPPSSNTSLLRPFAHDVMISLPTAVLPVMATMSTLSFSTSQPPTSPSPCTICRTLGGNADATASTVILPTRGVTSDGLTITTFPAAKAGRVRSKISSEGKFQGDMTTTTPRGSRMTKLWGPSSSSPPSSSSALAF